MTAPSPEELERRAYELWIQRGRPEGSPDADWLEAERQLIAISVDGSRLPDQRMDQPLDATFPSSDPPATHGADDVPSNADAKWRAAGKGKRRSASDGKP